MTDLPTLAEITGGDCGQCAELEPSQKKLIRFSEWQLIIEHLVAVHADLVPDYVPDCISCLEWQVLFAGPDNIPADVLAYLREVLAFQHRAGHLLTQQPLYRWTGEKTDGPTV